MKLDIKKILLVIYSFLAVLGLQFFIRISTNGYTEFIFIFVLALYCYYLSKQNYDKSQKRLYIFSGIITLILAIFLIIGKMLDLYSTLFYTLGTFLKIILLSLFLFPLIVKFIRIVEKFNYSKIKAPFKNKKFLNLKIFIALLITSIIIYLAMYPGIFGYDAGYQIYEFMFKDVPIGNRFSPLLSYVMYTCVMLGKNLFNSYEMGFGFFILGQILFLDLVCSYLLTYIYKKTENKYLTLILTFFFMFFPPHLIMQISSNPDAPFTGFMLLFLIKLMQIVNDKEDKLINYFVLGISLFMAFLMRNNGIYVMVFLIPCLLIFFFKYKKLILTLFVSLVLYCGYSYMLPSLGVEKENLIREMLGIPSQQIARAVLYNEASLNTKDLDKVNKFYPNYNFSDYNYRLSISDPIRGQIDAVYTKEHFIDYLKMYLTIGLKAPQEYIDAFLLNTLGIWYPDKFYNDSRMYHPYLELDMLDSKIYNERYIVIERNSQIPFVKDLIYKVMDDGGWQKKISGVGILSLFNFGFYFLMLLFILMYSFYKKNKMVILPLIFMIGYTLTIVVSPAILFRYVYPVVISSPLFIIMILELNKNNNRNKEKNE